MSFTQSELQALFANLTGKPQAAGLSPGNRQQENLAHGPSNSPGHSQRLPQYAPPSVSSPLFSPPVAGTPPHHGSDIISPNVSTPRNEPSVQTVSNSNRTAQLLNLLKVSNAAPGGIAPKTQDLAGESSGFTKQGAASSEQNQNGHTRGISASDLVASFMAKPTPERVAVSGSPSMSQNQPVEDAQEMLLRLLNRPKPQQNQSPEGQPVASPPEPIEPHVPEKEDVGVRKSSPVRTFGTRESRETTPFEPPKPQPPVQGSIFSYVNPFEQLAAASPRPRSSQANRTGSAQAVPVTDVHKGKEREMKPSNGLTRPREEFDSQSKADQAGGQGSPPEKKLKTKESVPEALGGVAEKVDTEVKAALAALAQTVNEEQVTKKVEDKTEELQQSATKIAKEAEKAGGGVPEELEKEPTGNIPVKPVDGAKEEEDLVDSWENETERVVPVYSFPLKPFVSITWKGVTTDPLSVRDDGFMDIARLKKPFDQLDRSLTSANAEYIVYALSKNGGMRIIRQDDGRDRQVFRSSNDRIFNVALCRAGSTPPEGKEEAVLGIGVSGSVYWASLSNGEDNLFERDALDTQSLILPPFPASDENTSGGQLKTRARPSSRHPEFFAIGRGKSIHVVWPKAAMSPKYGVSGVDCKVDTEKFYKERALKISTGKAGKDFVFSDDDTVIVSLDKTGRMRFWDIHDMIDASPGASKPDIRVPLLTLVTGTPNEKSWPTSVLFIDKSRPYLKMCAMRYMLVGFRQNHTLQLWDLGLGKAVQEINFPHEKESDAICSVAYHPSSGIIVVGHPTRNSIYFIHLSAPRYALPPMSQSAYIQCVVDKDEKVFGPQSTACMSGIRELSFGSRGQLRSLELLPLAKSFSSQRSVEDDTGLFELYVMHSRGVTCLNIKKADLGWSTDNKILKHVNSLENGLIELKDLQTLSSQPDEQSVSGEATSSVMGNNKEAAKKPEVVAEKPPSSQSPRSESPAKEGKKKTQQATPTTASLEPASSEKPEKKKKKKGAAENGTKAKEVIEAPQALANGDVQQETEPAKAVKTSLVEKSQVEKLHLSAIVPMTDTSTDVWAKGINDVKEALSAEFSKCLNHELGGFYDRFSEDRRSQDDLSKARQDAMLRLVSSTLSENVEKSLARIISDNIQSTVVPTIRNVTAASLEKKVAEELSKNLRATIPQSISNVFPDAVTRSLQAPNTLKCLSELVAPAVVKSVESELNNAVRNKIMPTIKNEFTRTAEKLVTDVEQMLASKINQFETQRMTDSFKIEQLTTQVNSLVQVISTMAASQTKFQGEILEMSRRFEEMQVAAQEPRAAAPGPVVEERPSPELSPEEAELREITRLMEAGDYEEASVKWLQSSHQAELFDNLFVNYGSDYLTTLSPLLSLSVSAAVTSSLETNVSERLDWLKQVFRTVNIHDPDIAQVVPQIMDVLIGRLQNLYMSIAQHSPHDPILPKIPPLTRWARDLKEANGY
ncbi:hypothetical protein CPC735_040840 [Coccidioides posadasii C735 delta SOWgp]|uniref:EDC4-like protein pdc1 beta-propeller domain-containing protein n=1 Tax=Coccidioides posadasii (strain C735) TaxID=222929 RepID=C5P3D2_COCP7|nr:hypothetical protein CPC735_040840 [Coccidioides posadasii C735 delta SOWgp]EER28820.1 hypothetical protein CPC735_040840 [Coccidioides posadasii C735 delta SOWgp]|eukprot:XP_003070965.1 hypothetical protein CPC735_040840 [Coccidioides posadasii C735 delta SOWgp]